MFVYDAVDGDAGKGGTQKNPALPSSKSPSMAQEVWHGKIPDQITTVVTIMKLRDRIDDF